MGLNYRKRIKIGRNAAVNLSGRGASVSVRAGRVAVNSRGRGSVRLAPGVSFRF